MNLQLVLTILAALALGTTLATDQLHDTYGVVKPDYYTGGHLPHIVPPHPEPHTGYEHLPKSFNLFIVDDDSQSGVYGHDSGHRGQVHHHHYHHHMNGHQNEHYGGHQYHLGKY